MASPEHESESKQVLEAQLRATLDVIPAYAWYTNRSGALTFVNQRCADYLGLPKDHPLRSGRSTGAAWDFHVLFLHPDDHEETRRVPLVPQSRRNPSGGRRDSAVLDRN